jgi:translation initiation factor IF-2
VLEAEVLQGKGIVAHLLVQDGTLKRGDVILAGEGYGKVRSIQDDCGEEIESAGPSSPVEVTGLSALPSVGEAFHVVERLENAKEVAEERSRKLREASLANRRHTDAATILAAGGKTIEKVNLIVRADVQGSTEVLKASLNDLDHEEVAVEVLQAGVGAVTENDVLLASTSGALIVAFRVGVGSRARQAADREGIDIQTYQVIYEVLDDVRDLMEGRLSPEFTEELRGHAEIKRVFISSKLGNIAGCMVLDGKISRNDKIRLLRDDQVIWTGGLASVRREKDEVKDVREGFECGLLLKNYNDIKEGDVIEAFVVNEVKRTLGST